MNKNYLNTYYNQQWVYKEVKNFFSLKELFRLEVINYFKRKFGSRHEDMLWSYLEPRLLANLLYFRKKVGKNCYINYAGMHQRGFRDILCKMVRSKASKSILYLSAHVRGNGIDFNVKKMNSEAVRQWFVSHSEELPYPCRFEHKINGKLISWVHMDSNYQPTNPKVYLFNV